MNPRSISQSLRDAIKTELANPAYEFPVDSTPILLHVAKSIRLNFPQAYDLSNPLDELVWLFSGGSRTGQG